MTVSSFVPLEFDDGVGSLDAPALHARYRSGDLTPERVVAAVFQRIAARGEDAVWITLVDRTDALAVARDLPGGPDDPATPLFGLPYAIKDNIDVAGLPTTAACPGFAHHPDESAEVHDRLAAAGAILIGKTNLDQFATGLNGTRSPYGVPTTPFDDARISGGSSSGSGVAVSAGLVTFSIGTDTAGSGRVPAALNNVVGFKPSIGLVGTRGVLPACHSLDCVSVFSLTVADGAGVLSVLAERGAVGVGDRDLPRPPACPVTSAIEGTVFAVPRASDIDFAASPHNAASWAGLLETLEAAGAECVETDFTPFFAAGRMLYSGGWLAERYSAVAPFLAEERVAVHPVVAEILEPGRTMPATRVFRDLEFARAIQAGLSPRWASVDALLTPTVTCTFTTSEMLADPVALNSRLGQFTAFTNILDLAAVAVPAGISADGLPFGVTVSAPAGSDTALAGLAAAIEGHVGGLLGATAYRAAAAAPAPSEAASTAPAPESTAPEPISTAGILVAVVGAHLTGMPLNSQLADLGAVFVERTATSPTYRLHDLPGQRPPKPGLRRVADGGVSIEVEVYRLRVAEFGRFVSLVPAPLAIGTVELADGTSVHGFVCEPVALESAPDISGFGGWRAYRRSVSADG